VIHKDTFYLITLTSHLNRSCKNFEYIIDNYSKGIPISVDFDESSDSLKNKIMPLTLLVPNFRG
jgi:hypothetical protein